MGLTRALPARVQQRMVVGLQCSWEGWEVQPWGKGSMGTTQLIQIHVVQRSTPLSQPGVQPVYVCVCVCRGGGGGGGVVCGRSRREHVIKRVHGHEG
jgi:hypothetical protein